jgi:hypothetical protein
MVRDKLDAASAELITLRSRNAVLEGALYQVLSALELCQRPQVEEPEMGAALRLIGMKVGFGAAMQSLSTSWRRVEQMKGVMGAAQLALNVGPCDAVLLPALRQGRAALKGTKYEHHILPAARAAEPADAGHVDLETSG